MAKNRDAENTDWWLCPSCGGQTDMVSQRTRSCKRCDWDVTIPTPEEYDAGE